MEARTIAGPIRSEQIIEFLGALKCQIKRPLLIVWDGVATHPSRLVKAWLEEQNGHIAVARLPPYAPEFNPVETIWAYLKKHEIANLCLHTIGAVGQLGLVITVFSTPRASLLKSQRFGPRPASEEKNDVVRMWRHLGFELRVVGSALAPAGHKGIRPTCR